VTKRVSPAIAAPRAALALAALALLAVGWGLAAEAPAEQQQRGNLIVSLAGELAPLKLPRDRLAPVAVRLEGGLRTEDGSTLPRVTRIQLGLPDQGVIDARGLPVCSPRRLRFATSKEARRACTGAIVGYGLLRAEAVLPNQAPLEISARMLAFNGRIDGRRAVVLHAFGENLPVAVVIPFLFGRSEGRLGTTLVADLPRALGPWPRFAHFEMTLSRRFAYRGERRSYISASCPIPPALTAGFFSLAQTKFTLAGGAQIGTAITRGCRGA
jgi:hypothetical protein